MFVRDTRYPLINDDPSTQDVAYPSDVKYGLVPRDYSIDPVEMFDSPSEIKLIPRSEWDARIDEQERLQSSLEHLYLQGKNQPLFENLDQDGNGYCWAYSTGHAVMLMRMVMNLPLVRLNPHSTAAIIKNGRDEGGWCGLSAKFVREHGMAPEGSGPGQWPLHSRNLRNDTPEVRTAMKRFLITEDWVDLTREVHSQNLTFDMVATLLLSNIPCPVDFNHWGHSVCAVRLIRVERGSYGLRILNSWKNWGRFGLGDLQGSKAIPNGSVAIRSLKAAA